MPVNRKVPLRLFHNGEEIINAVILATHSKEGTGPSTKHFVVINGVKTEVMTIEQRSKNRLFHQGKEITDATILATHRKEGKGPGSKHFVVINGIKTEVITAAQRTQNRLFYQDREITDAAILATHSKESKGSSSKHFVVINGVKTEVITAAQRTQNRLFHQGKEITDAAILATYSKEGKGNNTKHFVVINGVKTEVMNANQRTKNRLFHQGKEITDAAILATHSKEGKANSTKHFVVINGIKTEVFNRNQLKRRQPALQQPEEEERGVKRACLQTIGEENALTEYYNHLAELESFSTNQSTDNLQQAGEIQLMQEVPQSNGSVNSACVKTTGQRSTLAYSYDRILAELEGGFSSTQSTDALPEARQTRLMQDVAQANSLGCSGYTLFQPPNQHANPMGLPAGESRLLQQGDLLSRQLVAAYDVLEQVLFGDSESDNDASFTC